MGFFTKYFYSTKQTSVEIEFTIHDTTLLYQPNRPNWRRQNFETAWDGCELVELTALRDLDQVGSEARPLTYRLPALQGESQWNSLGECPQGHRSGVELADLKEAFHTAQQQSPRARNQSRNARCIKEFYCIFQF